MKKGDIYRWSYIESMGNQPLMYHCKSRVAVFDGEGLKDTFWNSRGDNHALNLAKVDIKFVANFDDLRNCSEGERVYFEDKDCVSLNHPNSSRGNFYIFNGAERSLNKMRLIQTRLIDKYRRDAEYATSALDREIAAMASMTVESSVFAANDVDHFDYGMEHLNE